MCLQGMILEKVREDLMVRTKISESSALRQKRGHTVVGQRPDCVETRSSLGLNNNGPIFQTEKNGLIHASVTTGTLHSIFDKMEELKVMEGKEEEKSLEVCKFES